MNHLHVKESLADTMALKLFNHIINTEEHKIKGSYGGYNKNDQAYDFSLICPNGLYRGNYCEVTGDPNFIIKIV